jgi:hypothetical protein
MPAYFFQSQDVRVKRNGLFKVGNTITGVEKLLDHVEKWHALRKFQPFQVGKPLDSVRKKCGPEAPS